MQCRALGLVCIYVCMHVCMYVYVCMYAYACMYVCMSVCMYLRMYMCMCVLSLHVDVQEDLIRYRGFHNLTMLFLYRFCEPIYTRVQVPRGMSCTSGRQLLEVEVDARNHISERLLLRHQARVRRVGPDNAAAACATDWQRHGHRRPRGGGSCVAAAARRSRGGRC